MWFWNKKTEKKIIEEPQKSNEETLLEDLPPKFQDNVDSTIQNRNKQRPSIKEAVSTVSMNDFKNLHKIPCFREAFMTGTAVSGVLFAVMITSRSALKRALNWSVIGFALSSTVTFEQCRYKKRKSQKNAETAKVTVNRRNQKPPTE